MTVAAEACHNLIYLLGRIRSLSCGTEGSRSQHGSEDAGKEGALQETTRSCEGRCSRQGDGRARVLTPLEASTGAEFLPEGKVLSRPPPLALPSPSLHRQASKDCLHTDEKTEVGRPSKCEDGKRTQVSKGHAASCSVMTSQDVSHA